VLEVYHRPYDPQVPVVCMDEKPYQLPPARHQPAAHHRGPVRIT